MIFVAVIVGALARAAAAPEGTRTYGVDVTVPSRWLDRAGAEGIATLVMVLYALQTPW